jgi:hypothetical protein
VEEINHNINLTKKLCNDECHYKDGKKVVMEKEEESEEKTSK